jgi:acetyl-CoA synthetase
MSSSFQVARETLHWDRPFQTVRAGGFETGDIVWFPEGGLNASYNCVDRWAFKHPNKVSVCTRSWMIDPLA